ncbi:protein of unknown function [Candidatus Nitrotoga arctica]|uniref:GtrA-like protein n=1 Tax=Candidatus Nitrotoga arctica TaxID=453162 RepID=A0ABM8YZ15_9PROT|nr:protein of unknown function [Candidatus Nitrotoga arctica]
MIRASFPTVWLFLLTGVTAAAVNFFSRLLYNHWLDYSSSIIVAYLSAW